MTASSRSLAVHREVTVPLPPDEAFELFTARMDAFWPAGHSILDVPRAAVVAEPRAGGAWYETGTDGSRCPWGRVAVWDPPGRLVLIWQLGPDFRHDPQLETEVEVLFTDAGPGRTRVALTHRLEGFGRAAGTAFPVLDSDNGWTAILDAFAVAAG